MSHDVTPPDEATDSSTLQKLISCNNVEDLLEYLNSSDSAIQQLQSILLHTTKTSPLHEIITIVQRIASVRQTQAFLESIAKETLYFCKQILLHENHDIISSLQILQELYNRVMMDDFSVITMLIDLMHLRDESTCYDANIFFGNSDQYEIRRQAFITLCKITSAQDHNLWKEYITPLEDKIMNRKGLQWLDLEASVYALTACLSALTQEYNRTHMSIITNELMSMLNEPIPAVLEASVLNSLRFYYSYCTDYEIITSMPPPFLEIITSDIPCLRDSAPYFIVDVLAALYRSPTDMSCIDVMVSKFEQVIDSKKDDQDYLLCVICILDFIAGTEHAITYKRPVMKLATHISFLLESNKLDDRCTTQLFQTVSELIDKIQEHVIDVIDPLHHFCLSQIESFLIKANADEGTVSLYMKIIIKLSQYMNDTDFLEQIKNLFLMSFSETHKENMIAREFSYRIVTTLSKRNMLSILLETNQEEKSFIFDVMVPDIIDDLDIELDLLTDYEGQSTPHYDTLVGATEALGNLLTGQIGNHYEYFVMFEERHVEDVVRISYAKLCQFFETGEQDRQSTAYFAMLLARISILYTHLVAPLLFTYFGCFLCEVLHDLSMDDDQVKDCVEALEKMMTWHLETGAVAMVHGSHQVSARDFAECVLMFLPAIIQDYPALHLSTKHCAMLAKVMRYRN
jgi:hypothetical protein